MLNKYFTLALLCGVLMSACGSGENSGEVKIDGSSTVFPITEAVSEEFRSEAPGVRVTVGVSGTGGGFKKFLRGETDINNASREIQPIEIKQAEEAGMDYLRLSVAFDGLAVVVHPENNWVDYFTVQELKELWRPEAQASVTQWSDIREGWPDEDINLYGPGIASGTYDYFTEAIVGESGSSRGDFTASEDDNVLVQGVSTDKYALGFFGLAYFEENADKLQLVPVKKGDNEPVKPTLETVADNTYTPLSRPLFIYVSGQAAENKQVREFVNFYLNNAPQLAREIGYVPMPDSLYQVQKDKFREFHSKADSAATK